MKHRRDGSAAVTEATTLSAWLVFGFWRGGATVVPVDAGYVETGLTEFIYGETAALATKIVDYFGEEVLEVLGRAVNGRGITDEIRVGDVERGAETV